MAISVTCESCWLTFDVSDAHAGKRGKCPECGSPVDVPRAASRASAGGQPPRTAPRRPSGERKRSRTSAPASRKPMWIWIGAGGGAAAILGIVAVVAFSVGRSNEPEAPANSTPQLTAANGSTPNAANTPPATSPQTAGAGSPRVAGGPAGNASPAGGAPGYASPASGSPGPMGQYSPTANPSAQYGQYSGYSPSGPGATGTTGYPGGTTPGSSPSSAAGPMTVTEQADGEGSPAAPDRRNLADLIESVEPSVVRIDVRDAEGEGNGSGFVVDAEGIIATNYHVIAGVSSATAIFPDGGQAPIVGHVFLDPKRDIALLKINYPAEKLKPLALAAAHPRKGESVVAFGAPLGLSFSASEGIISAIRPAPEVGKTEGSWIQTTTPISPGNSGGPLVNQRGEVVAMNTMAVTIGQNLNFSISSVDIAEALPKRVAQAVPLSPESAPAVANAPSREKVVDETGTDRGKKLLSEIQSVHLVVATFSFDPTGRIEQTVLSEARKAVERAGIEEAFGIERNPAMCLVTMELGGTSGAAGARELTLGMVVLCRTTDERGEVQVAQVWKERERVGTFSLQSLHRGVIPTRAQSTMSSFFRKFTSAVRRADRAQEQEESDEKAAGDAEKPDE